MKSNTDRIWSEQDFNQLYEQYPKILSSSTYTVLHLLVDSLTLAVKVPTGCNQQVHKFLLYRALYFHHLNAKSENPLCRTAAVAYFESVQGFQSWYQLWAFGKSIPKNSTIKCVMYQSEETMNRYQPLAILHQSRGFVKVLARSRKDGNYYNISVVQNSAENDQKHLHQSYKSLQHPFICHLSEYHRNQQYSYFVFQHQPHTLAHFASSAKLSRKQLHTCFIELLLALAFLDQQPILSWDVSTDMIRLAPDGHILLAENVVESRETTKHHLDVLIEFFQKITTCDSLDTLDRSQKQTSFKQYLSELGSRKKWNIKQILNQPWVKEQNIQSIIGKNNPGLDMSAAKPKIRNRLVQITEQQIDTYFLAPYRDSQRNRQFQSYKISCQTANEMVIKRYSKVDRNEEKQYGKRLKKTSSSLSMHKKQSRFYLNPKLAWHDEETKSPYDAVLRKDRKLRKRNMPE